MYRFCTVRLCVGVLFAGLNFNVGGFCEELFDFGGQLRFPRPMKVVFHNCSVQIWQNFPVPTTDPEFWDSVKDATYRAKTNSYTYFVLVSHLVIQIDQCPTKKDRYIAFHRELDKIKYFWPFPAEQVEWLQSLVKKCKPEHRAKKLQRMNNKGQYSIRQVIRRYLENDGLRRTGLDWAPTGVWSEKYHLTWRDCFFLAASIVDWVLLGPELPPRHSGPDRDVIELFRGDERDELAFFDCPSEDPEELAKQVSMLKNDGGGHCKFGSESDEDDIEHL